jgi:hypothetical protein
VENKKKKVKNVVWAGSNPFRLLPPLTTVWPNYRRLACAALQLTPTGRPGQAADVRSHSLVPVSLSGGPHLSALSPQP